jgi:phospholipase/carboxylesterase
VSRAEAGSALDFERSGPTDAAAGDTVAVLLHGRGSDKHDLQGLRPQLPADWVLITPQAPFPGAPWGYGGGGAWYRYQQEDEVQIDTLRESLSRLDAFLSELPGLVGFEPGRLILGGFSQGGTVSLAYALSRPRAVAAALNFSGFLAAAVELDESGAAPPETPIYWGHGVGDPAIPIALAEKGRNRLRRAGAKLDARDYRIGHWIAEDEIADAVAMVSAAPA